MFALGVSMYELASPYPLPANGEAYHALRDGAAPKLIEISQPLQVFKAKPAQLQSHLLRGGFVFNEFDFVLRT